MKNFLEDLFFGEIQANISADGGSAQCKRCSEIIDKNEETLLRLLSGKERALLLDLVNAQSERSGELALGRFVYGFKLGANMVLEILRES